MRPSTAAVAAVVMVLLPWSLGLVLLAASAFVRAAACSAFSSLGVAMPLYLEAVVTATIMGQTTVMKTTVMGDTTATVSVVVTATRAGAAFLR